VAVLLLLDRRFKLRNGMMLWSYIVWYTLGRIPIESIRLDQAQEFTILGITARTNTWTSVLMFLIASVLLIYSIVTRPKTPAERAEADRIFLDKYYEKNPDERPEDPVVNETAVEADSNTDESDLDKPSP